MAFKDLMDKAHGLADAATDTAGKYVDEFNQALPVVRGLGFTIKDLRMGMGLLPEIGATLVASTDTIDPKKIKELLDKNPENKTLAAMLKALLAAYNIKQQIADLPLKGIELDVTLGLPPHIGVNFVTASPAAASAAASGGAEKG